MQIYSLYKWGSAFKDALSPEFLATESPLKIFISPKKLLSFWSYLNFCLDILVM